MEIQTVSTTISVANQTAVPAPVRKKLNLKPGDKLLWQVDEKTQIAKVTTLPRKWGTYMRGLGQETWKGLGVDKYIKDGRKDRKLP